MNSPPDYAELRRQALEQYAGTPINPITAPQTFHGVWDMRFGGPVGSDKVQWRYNFRSDGTANVNGEVWQWRLNEDGTLILVVPVKADPSTPGLEEDTAVEEVRLAFKTTDDRIIVSNDDTSVVEILTPVMNEGT